MRVVVQRVRRASVRVNGATVGAIEEGLLVLLGIASRDTAREAEWLATKVPSLRVFAGSGGTFDRSLADVGGAILVVSQFTLYGDARKGRRPDFTQAAEPELAESLYDHFVVLLRAGGWTVATGVFGAMMEVELINDGPVTLILERAAPDPSKAP